MDTVEKVEGGFEPKKKTIPAWTVIVIALVVLGVGYYVYNETNSSPSVSKGDSATTTITQNGVTFTLPPGSSATVTQVPVEEKDLPPQPNLERPIVFPASYSEEAKPLVLARFADVKKKIAANPRDTDLWIEAGLTLNMVEDYKGAVLMWEYAKALYPTNSVAWGNLGFVYAFHLKEYDKAETSYKQAISLTPDRLYLYEQFFSFYRDIRKNYVEARALANAGVKATGDRQFFDKLLLTLK